MSLNRLCLRLAAIVALSNNGAAPWPTAAGSRIFDGRIEPLEDLFGCEGPAPIIMVETPVHEGGVAVQGLKGDSIVDLVFDCGMVVSERSEEGFSIALPQTDSELDTALDLLEAQLHAALAASDLFQQVSQGILAVSSVLAPAEDGQRTAIRYVRYQVKLLRDHFTGQVPAHIAPLLTALAANPAFAERAQAIAAVWTAPAAANEALARMLDRKWSAGDADALGYSVAGGRVPAQLNITIDHPAGYGEQEEGGLA